MSVPLIARDKVIGGLHFRSTLPNRYNEETLRLAERIGMQIAAGIANAQLFNDLKKTEKSLRESEEWFRLAFRTSPDAININRLNDGMFVDINEGFTRLTGYTREDVIGKTSLAIDLWCHPEDRKTLVQGLRERGYYENLEAEFRRKDGSSGPALMSARILDLQGVAHILSITRDISDLKRAEEEKRHLEERLQRAEKMEALGQLAGGVAHDLNNVLGILSGYSELLLEQIPEGNRSRNYVEKILQSTEKGAAIIQDLLTLARRGVVVSDVINLNSVVSAFFKTPVFE
jgi:PAS domain S-box-containing protein